MSGINAVILLWAWQHGHQWEALLGMMLGAILFFLILYLLARAIR